MKNLTKIIIAALVVVVAILSYDFYMRNSGISNRVTYEQQKYDVKEEFREERREDRQEQREERRERRREKIRNFFN